MMRLLFACVAALLFVAAPASAQKPISEGVAIEETFTIDSIDHSARVVTLKDKDGNLEDVYCGPEVQRFNQLKVGDKVTFRYYESVVMQIRKPGTAPESASSKPALTRTPGSKPGGTMSQQMTATVTVNAIDPKTPAVTITSSDGRKMSFKVENKKYLEGVKVGDKVEITYTQALAVSVK
jgi:Cu/Ag efflux protein CusF